MSDDLSRPFGRVVEPRHIGRRRQVADIFRFVEIEIFGSTVDRDIAPAATESRQAHAFGNVLPHVPGHELVFEIRRDAVPDGKHAFADQRHGMLVQAAEDSFFAQRMMCSATATASPC